jgi:hypothetical protein
MNTVGFVLLFSLAFGPRPDSQGPATAFPTMDECITVLESMVWLDPTMKVGCYKIEHTQVSKH